MSSPAGPARRQLESDDAKVIGSERLIIRMLMSAKTTTSLPPPPPLRLAKFASDGSQWLRMAHEGRTSGRIRFQSRRRMEPAGGWHPPANIRFQSPPPPPPDDCKPRRDRNQSNIGRGRTIMTSRLLAQPTVVSINQALLGPRGNQRASAQVVVLIESDPN